MPKKKTTSNKPTSKIGKDILVNVILDRSGSMQSNRQGTINGYNEYLNGLKADKDTNYCVSLTQFDMMAASPELTVSYLDQPLAEVPDLTLATYEPRGSTPLYDAIGETCRRVKDYVKGRPVLTVIITDGQENASTEFTQESVRALIKQLETEGWTFVFIGADINSYAVASSVGINVKNTSNYAKGREGATFSAMAMSTRSFADNRRTFGMFTQAADEAFLDNTQRCAMGDKTGGVNPTTAPSNPNIGSVTYPIPDQTLTTGGAPSNSSFRRWNTTTTVVKP